jgi:hypothetical protein
MANNEYCKVIKVRLKSILVNNEKVPKELSINYDNFFDCIDRANYCYFICSNFIRSYLLYTFNESNVVPVINYDFIRMAFKAISKSTCGPKPKNEQLITYNNLCDYFKNNFVKILTKDVNITDIEKYKLDSKNLSYIFNSFATEMETSYKNNIQLNFFKYLNQYVNENFITKKVKKLSKSDYLKLSKDDRIIYRKNLEEEGERIKEIKKELKLVKDDLIDGTLFSDKKYHKWIKENKDKILPALTEKITSHETGLKIIPFKYLKYMMSMNKDLELNEHKLFQPISLRTSLVDKYVVIDTSTLKDIFTEIGTKKSNDELWDEYFNINFKKYKLKGYTFNHMISTDGYVVSIYFIKNNEIEKKNKKIKLMTQASKLGKINGKKTEEEKQNKKIEQYNKAQQIKKEKKEAYNKLSKEEQEKIKLELKKNKNRYAYIEDAIKNPEIYERLKEAHKNGKIKVIDLGKRCLATILGKGRKTRTSKRRKNLIQFNYTNKRRLVETKRLKIGKLIKNKKKNTIINKTTLENKEQELSKYNQKTINVKKFNEYIGMKIELKNKVNKEKEYNKYIKQQNWKGYINKRKHEDNILNEIEEIYGSAAIFVVGDWSNKTKLRGISTPNLRVKKLLERRFEVYLINEYNTSKLYHKTEEEGKNLTIKKEITIKEEKKVVQQKIHAILTFKMSEKRSECINRDYNATLNMIKIVEYLIRYKTRPEKYIYTKKETTEKKKLRSPKNKSKINKESENKDEEKIIKINKKIENKSKKGGFNLSSHSIVRNIRG